MILFFDFCFMTFYFLILLFVLFFMIFGQGFWGLRCGRWESSEIVKNRTSEVAETILSWNKHLSTVLSALPYGAAGHVKW